MKATPIIPGELYRVSYKGDSLIVEAPNAAAALAIITEGL